jgi:serine phosphatase RsbU (regulator of sigma subunit)/anti-sigma regulatory factor (Ser/Thr protein kinase)
LASQAAPAVRVAQLVREQEAQARATQRLEHELEVARLIQQNLLPKQLPDLPGWEVAAFYRPARTVGGDFYDFIELPDAGLGIVVGDVTDKGVPAAMVMAATRTVLRASAQTVRSPGAVLEQVNELLCPDMPPNMFVTCLYGVLDPRTGAFRYANAGHNLPYVRTADGVLELRATGMPLGLMPAMTYEEHEATLAPGQSMLLSSDGIVEAHGRDRQMFGFPRLRRIVGARPDGGALIDVLLGELETFTGEEWEQEDDITLVTLTRSSPPPGSGPHDGLILDQFTVPSERGNERLAIERVAEAAEALLAPASLERLKTAVGEATMNAIEHGNHYRSDAPVAIRIRVLDGSLHVDITDQGGGLPIPQTPTPDLEAKLAGRQPPRGWGLFLIEHMVGDVSVESDERHHTIELALRLDGGDGGDTP